MVYSSDGADGLEGSGGGDERTYLFSDTGVSASLQRVKGSSRDAAGDRLSESRRWWAAITTISSGVTTERTGWRGAALCGPGFIL